MRVNHYYVAAVAAATAVSAASLKDIKHVVLFMQENRAFDHVSICFGDLRARNVLLMRESLRLVLWNDGRCAWVR